MQADNQGTDHLAGPFGCVFTLFDSQPWTKRNMLVNSRKQTSCWKDHRQSRVIGKEQAETVLGKRETIRASWCGEM
jgi:hypothetical protein